MRSPPAPGPQTKRSCSCPSLRLLLATGEAPISLRGKHVNTVVPQQGAARSVDAADGSGRSAAGGSGAGSAVVESAAGESAAGGSAAGESGAGSAVVSAAGESGAGSTAGGSSAGAAVADAGADPGAVDVAAGATGSVPPVPYFEEVDLDIEEQSEPKKQQAPVAAENLSISQFAGTEAASTSCTGRDPTVITNEGKGMLNSQASCEGEDMEAPGGRKGRRILKFVDKIAKSKYFQKATENEFIKKKIEEMSNTPLLLTVEVQELSGTLVINIPPPPSDRIWYSFCMPPKLDLRVRPKLGEREVTFCHVTEWIERKLQQEFKKVFVLPNMDDIYVPLMHSGLDRPLVSQKLSPQSEQSPFYVDSMERDPAEITRAESH
ncbi:unnamed protein product [Arctogadus glacialis]